MRKQVKFSYQVAVNAAEVSGSSRLTFAWGNVQDKIIAAASALCGGCTVNEATGYWTDGGTHAKSFEGQNLHKELCLSLDLTTELDKEETVYESMAASIKEIANQHAELEIQWVHCNRSEVIGMHFNVLS